MRTCSETIHPFTLRKDALNQLRAELVRVAILPPEAYLTEITTHVEGFSLDLRLTCPYNRETGGACLNQALQTVFRDGHPPLADCEFARLAAQRRGSSNKI